jgi:hypothetical protein
LPVISQHQSIGIPRNGMDDLEPEFVGVVQGEFSSPERLPYI